MKKRITLTLMLMGSLAGMGQWSSNTEANHFIYGYLRSNNPTSWSEKVKTKPDGDTYLLFQSNTLSPALSLVDQKGYYVWNPGIVFLSGNMPGWTELTCDSDGNAIAGMTSGRWTVDGHHLYSIQLHKISPAGESLWGSNGLVFSDPDHNLVGSSMTLCNDGSLLLVYQSWEDTTNQPASRIMVRKVHRILPDGTLAWGSEGLTFSEHAWTEIYPLEDGTFFRLWYVPESLTPSLRYSVWAQYYDPAGQPVWAKDLKIYDNQKDYWPALAGVFNNTLYISWFPYNIQMVNRQGNELYAPGGEPVFGKRFGSFSSIEPIGKDPKGNLVFSAVFQMNALLTHRIHKMSPSGELLWGPEGKELLPVKYSAAPVHFRLDSTGNLYIFYRDPAVMGLWAENSCRLWVDGFDTDGNKRAGFPVLISSQKRLRSPGHVSEVKNGQMIYLWEEKVQGSNLTFYAAQNINTDGTLGNLSTGIGETRLTIEQSYIGYDVNSRALVLQPSDKPRKIRLISLTGSTELEIVTTDNPVVPANLRGMFILEIDGSAVSPERHKILVF